MEDITLSRVIEQFVGLLSSRQLSEQDQSDITDLIRTLSSVAGDPTRLLKDHPATMVTASWYSHKFSIITTDQARLTSQKLNEVYSNLRKNGYDEWTAKRMAETNLEYITLQRIEDSCRSISDVLSALVKISEQRLRILEQLSNNYRTEMRTS